MIINWFLDSLSIIIYYLYLFWKQSYHKSIANATTNRKFNDSTKLLILLKLTSHFYQKHLQTFVDSLIFSISRGFRAGIREIKSNRVGIIKSKFSRDIIFNLYQLSIFFSNNIFRDIFIFFNILSKSTLKQILHCKLSLYHNFIDRLFFSHFQISAHFCRSLPSV